MIRRAVVVTNQLGLHARAAARFVEVASGVPSSIHVTSGGRVADGKSILALLLLGAARGSTLTIEAADADEAGLSALCALVERGFDES